MSITARRSNPNAQHNDHNTNKTKSRRSCLLVVHRHISQTTTSKQHEYQRRPHATTTTTHVHVHVDVDTRGSSTRGGTTDADDTLPARRCEGSHFGLIDGANTTPATRCEGGHAGSASQHEVGGPPTTTSIRR